MRLGGSGRLSLPVRDTEKDRESRGASPSTVSEVTDLEGHLEGERETERETEDDGEGDTRIKAPSSASVASPSLTPAPRKTSIQLHTLSEETHNLCPDDHDIIVWMGDLNYRIVKGAIDDDTVMQMIQEKQYMELSEYDQLQQQRERNQVFEDFNEGLRLFPPTYKYDVGTAEYDYYHSKKKRCPAWCDRILWRTTASIGQDSESAWDPSTSHSNSMGLRRARRQVKMKGRRHYHADFSSNGLPCENSTGVNLLAYNACHKVLSSDHMPVFGAFNVRVRRMDWKLREAMLLGIHKAAAEMWFPNEHSLCYGLGTRMVALTPSRFALSSNNRESVDLQLHLRNTFPAPASQSQDDGGGDVVACGILAYTLPPWLSVSSVLPATTAGGDGNGENDAMLDSVKSDTEPQWIDLCVLREGETVDVSLQLDCIKAISEYGIESFKQEARLKGGAQTLQHTFGGATTEAEVLRGAETLLKTNGEERAEVCATLCLRCRKLPKRLDGAESEAIIGKPLDFYVPVTLQLGREEDA
jgi:hypothetical protein